MKIIATWTRCESRLPEPGTRVLVFSPVYKRGDPMRLRIMDGEFVVVMSDATCWLDLKSLDPEGLA